MARFTRALALAAVVTACVAAVVAACAAASPPPGDAPDATTLISGLRVKVQQKQKLEARQPVVQDAAAAEQKSIDASTAALAQALAPIKTQHAARCFGTFPEPEYSNRVRECAALAARAQELGANYQSEIAPHQKALAEANAELSEIQQALPVVDSSIRSLKLQLRARFPTCAGDAEALVDCFQRAWDGNRLHPPLSVPGGGASLGVDPGNDKTLQAYQHRFDTLEGERRTIEQRLEALANQPATAANLQQRTKLKDRIAEIGSTEAYLRFKAKDHTRPSAPTPP